MNAIKQRNINLIILFLIYPLLSTPYILKSARKGQKVGLFLLCNLFALIGFLMIPSYDVVNHGTWAYRCIDTGVFWLHYADATDLLLPSLGYLFLSNDISFHYIIYIFTLIAGINFWSIYYDITKVNCYYNSTKLFYVCLLCFPLLGVITGLRYYTATCILLRGLFLYFFMNKKSKGIILLFISPFVHFSMIILVGILLIALFYKLKFNRFWTFFIFTMLCIFSVVIIQYILPFIETYFREDKVSMYTDAEDLSFLNGQNVNYLFIYYLKIVLNIPLMLFLYYKCYNIYKNDNLNSIYKYYLFLYAISFGYVVISGRFSAFAYLIFILLISNYIIQNQIPKKYYHLLIYTKTINYILAIWDLKHYLLMSNHFINLLYMPYPLLMYYSYSKNDYLAHMCNKEIITKNDLNSILSTDKALYPKLNSSFYKKWKNILATNPINTQEKIFQYIMALRHAEYHDCKSLIYVKNKSMITIWHTLMTIYFYWKLRKLSYQIGIQIPPHTCGAGLQIWHYGYLIINSAVRIGKNAVLYPGVEIGEKNGGCPTIGNNVFIGAGAKIFGPIKIGNNVTIAANSVVIKDIPDNAIVGGVPAKIIKMKQ